MMSNRPTTRSLGPTRRRFLQGTVAAVGSTALLPSWLAGMAGAGTPLGDHEGMLVVVTLRGGNDALNTVVPAAGTMRNRYESLRGAVALPSASLLQLDAASEWGLHPKLANLATRSAKGQVAFVQGVGTPTPDLSHFRSMDLLSAGAASEEVSTGWSTGWVGRFLDHAPNWDSGLAGLTLANAPKLMLTGERAKVPVLTSTGALWGTSSDPWDRCAVDALKMMAAAPTGFGPLADALAETSVEALSAVASINPMYSAALPSAPLSRDLTLAARALNAGAGTRCVSVELSSFDTHALQLGSHADLLGQLDAGIEAFWTSLTPALASRVVMLVVSEFGRRPAANGSLGTDHGTAGMAMLIGPSVQGGLAGEQPSLSKLDADGNLTATVDIRSVYATVLSDWLAADDHEILGATYPKLDLFST